MKCMVRFKGIDHSQDLSNYVMDRMDKLSRFEMKPLKAHITFSAVKHMRIAEIYVNGLMGTFRARASKESYHEAFDTVMKKMEKQMLKEKSKVKHHKTYGQSAEAQLAEMVRIEERLWRRTG